MLNFFAAEAPKMPNRFARRQSGELILKLQRRYCPQLNGVNCWNPPACACDVSECLCAQSRAAHPSWRNVARRERRFSHPARVALIRLRFSSWRDYVRHTHSLTSS